MVRLGGARILPVLCGASDHACVAAFPVLRAADVVSVPQAPKPQDRDDVGTDVPDCPALGALAAHRASLPGTASVRQYLRQEPSALVAHAGICAGGAGQPALLPRPGREPSPGRERLTTGRQPPYVTLPGFGGERHAGITQGGHASLHVHIHNARPFPPPRLRLSVVSSYGREGAQARRGATAERTS
jgi:hypothetical protein